MNSIDSRRGHALRAAKTMAVTASLLFASTVTLAATMPSAPSVPPEQREGVVAYRVGGIGKEEASQMRQISAHYPVELTFVERRDDGRTMFTTDIDVRITDQQGRASLETLAKGPMMLVDLPAGRYTIEATLAGQVKQQSVVVTEGDANRLIFVWPEQA